jgi:mono/diheme cytochrome c family protein
MRSSLERLAEAGGVLLVCSVFLAGSTLVRAADQSAQQRGAFDFHTRGCERCHSITGVGGDRAPDLGSVGLRRTSGQIRRQILKGGHGMPPFAKVLPGHDVDDLVAFLSSCHTDQAPGCRQWDAPNK